MATSPRSADATSIEPLRRVPLYENIAERLRQFIADEQLEPGSRLPPERVLAERLGVSRTSVRQGLTALRVMGLVTIHHGAGAYLARSANDLVPPIGADIVLANPELPAIGEADGALEGEVARLAAARRTDGDLELIADAIAAMARAIERGQDCVDADRDFHSAIAEASHNPVLNAMLRSIADGTRQIAAASLSRPGQPARSLDTHRLIFEAIRDQDATEAGRLMLEHLVISGELELS